MSSGSSLKPDAPELAPEREPQLAASSPAVMRIDSGLQIEGSLVVQKSVEVDGEFRGSIQSEATIVIGADAGVQADLRARVIVIRGAVVGNVVATRELILHATGRLTGDVETLSFTIEKGAFFNGRTVMISPQLKLRVADADQPAPESAPL